MDTTNQVSVSGTGGQVYADGPSFSLETIEDISSELTKLAVQHPMGNPHGQRDWAHREGKCTSPMNGTQQIFALLSYEDIRTLEGRLLTIVDASFTDRDQRKAVKDLVRNAVWFDWAPNLDTDNIHFSIPSLR